MRSTARLALLLALAFCSFSTRASAQTASSAACASLAEQKLPNTTITSAQPVTSGTFTPTGSTNPIANLPPFCRVAGVIAPTSDSQILFEVWLPLEKWNGKFAGVGNGGWAGVISFPQLADQLRRGYAAASTNTGHEAAGGMNAARFAFEKPERLIDFAYRSHHETALKAKAITEAFYAKAPERSYFIGCSSGGYEGLMEAQRFPDDYDGIVAGMPANNWTRLMAGDFDATLAVFKDGVNNLPTTALGLLHRARWPPATAQTASSTACSMIRVDVRSIRRACRARPVSRQTPASQLPKSTPPGVYMAASRIRRPARNSIRVSCPAASSSGRIAISRIHSRSRSRTTSGSCLPIRIGTGRRSTSATPLTTRRTRRPKRSSRRSSTRPIRISRRSGSAAASCCNITGGTIS